MMAYIIKEFCPWQIFVPNFPGSDSTKQQKHVIGDRAVEWKGCEACEARSPALSRNWCLEQFYL